MKRNGNWEYADLLDTDRLEKVRNGSLSVYRAESENNANLKKQYQEAGVDTSGIDKWQGELDAARAEAAANIPTFTYNPEILRAKENVKKAKQAVSEVFEQAAKASAAIDESFVNRGVKLGSSEYEAQRQLLKQGLIDALESIDKTYGQGFAKANKKKIDLMFS